MSEKKRLSVAVAESMTGGLLQSLIVGQSGASNWFRGGIVCYSLDSKITILKVNPEEVNKFNGVSIEIAEQMAAKVSALFDTDIGISITGYSEPTPSAPVFRPNFPNVPITSYAYYSIYYKGKETRTYGLYNVNNLLRTGFQNYTAHAVYAHLLKILNT